MNSNASMNTNASATGKENNDRCPITMSGNEATQLFNMLKEKLDELKVSIEKSIDEIKSCINRDRERRSVENEQLHSRISECNNRITSLETGKISQMDTKLAVLSDQAGAGVALRGHLIWLVFAIVASVVSGTIVYVITH